MWRRVQPTKTTGVQSLMLWKLLSEMLNNCGVRAFTKHHVESWGTSARLGLPNVTERKLFWFEKVWERTERQHGKAEKERSERGRYKETEAGAEGEEQRSKSKSQEERCRYEKSRYLTTNKLSLSLFPAKDVCLHLKNEWEPQI